MARNCKYHKIETKISYDDGQTWESQTPPVYHIGGLIEVQSQDCETGTTLERWITVEGDYLCDGNNKWTKQLLQNSYDGGVTWYASSPTTFRLGEFVEVDEEYCLYSSESHYVIPDYDIMEMCMETTHCNVGGGYELYFRNGACRCVYVDPIKIVKCSTDTLTSLNLANGKYGLQTLKIGECTRVIAIGDTDWAILELRPYLTTIDTTNATNLEIISDYSFAFCNGWLNAIQIHSKKGNGLQSIAIPSSVTTIGEHAFYACSAMTSVTISDAQCSIGSNAFGDCISLVNLNLGNSVTSIGSMAFMNCSGLTSINIPDSVTSIGSGAFSDCSGLTSVSIGSGVTSIGSSAFYRCSNLTSIGIPSGVTSIGEYAFGECTGLTSIDIPNSVTSIGQYAFDRCSGMTSCTIGSGVTSIGDTAFQYCSGLTSIVCNATTPPTLGWHSFDNGNSCTIYVPCDSYYAYKNDSSWSRYNSRIRPIQPCDYQYKASVIYGGVTTYDVLCNSNSALTSNELSSGGSKTNITSADIGNCTSSISANTFQNCYRLTNIHISSSVTSVGDGAFASCSALSEVHIDDVAAWCNIDFTTGLSTNPIAKSGKLYLNNQRVRNLSIPSGVTSIGNYAFSGFTDLTSMTLSNTVSSIGNSTFYRCRNLSSVDFGSGLTSIGTSAFTWCTGLTSVELPDSITTIGESAFRNCSGATSFGIGSGITSIGASAFTNCSSLTAITISASTPPRLEGNMDRRTFENTNNCPIYVPCASVNAYKTTGGWSNYLSRIQGFGICPSKLIATYSDSTVDTIDCNGDSSLGWSETRNMSNPVSSMTVADIGNCATNINGAFNGATSLTSVTMPDSVVSLVNNAFRNCSGITSIDLSSGLTTIGEGSFRNCKELTAITIPSGVTSIGDWAFYNCVRLTSMTVEATTPPTLGSNALGFTNNCPIYVPAASVSSYQSASVWSDYASRIQAIPSTVKLLATYSDSSVASICCNDSSTLTSSEISNLPNPRTAMTSADIGSCVTSIGGDAFNYYVSLTSCTIPSSVTSIGNRAFQDCSGLTSINIPDSVTSISNYAFRYCSGLTSIEIGSGVTSIGNMSFWSCTNLTSITVNAVTPPTLGSSVLYGTPIASGTGTIYVPAASVSSYQSASGWSDYASRIQAIT